MKPLTAEEIAEERENLRENDGDDAVGLPTDRLARLLDEVERSRALLKRIEWNGEWSRDLVYRCPLCGGYKPGAYLVEQVGHAPDCELAALIAT